MEYRSALETLECFSNALATHFAHHLGAWKILHALVKVSKSQKLLIVVKKVPGSLYYDF